MNARPDLHAVLACLPTAPPRYSPPTRSRQVNVGSLEEVIKYLLQVASARAEEASKAAAAQLDAVEDLEAEASPEEMMLSYVSGEKSKDRTDREVVTPWFKFLWETYRCGAVGAGVQQLAGLAVSCGQRHGACLRPGRWLLAAAAWRQPCFLCSWRHVAVIMAHTAAMSLKMHQPVAACVGVLHAAACSCCHAPNPQAASTPCSLCLVADCIMLCLPMFACRNVLDILRNNSRLEALYAMVAARACQVRHVACSAGVGWHGINARWL